MRSEVLFLNNHGSDEVLSRLVTTFTLILQRDDVVPQLFAVLMLPRERALEHRDAELALPLEHLA